MTDGQLAGLPRRRHRRHRHHRARTALTIRNSRLGERRSGVFTSLGVAAGRATWTVATSAGIAALLVASEPVFRAVRYAGAIYMTGLVTVAYLRGGG